VLSWNRDVVEDPEVDLEEDDDRGFDYMDIFDYNFCTNLNSYLFIRSGSRRRRRRRSHSGSEEGVPPRRRRRRRSRC
jgi:hypothetical protein